MQGAKQSITSRVTIKNPRPRKYASAAEKQAAFRARFPTICVRVEPKTAETVQAIADASGRTQQETLLSMLKYAMTNRNWLTLGLTEHKQLPRIEEPRKENPMKRKPSPAQIAARERFAEMARSGAFKKKATKARKKNPLTYGLESNPAKKLLTSVYSDVQLSRIYNNDPVLKQLNKNLKNIEENYPIERSYGKNLFEVVETRGKEGDALYDNVMAKIDQRTKQINAELNRKSNPMIISKQADESLSRKGSRGYVRQLLDRYSDDGHVVSVKKTRSGSIGIAFDGGRLLTVASARKKLEDHYGITERMGRRANPISDIANIIYNQLGANRFAMMTGAKNFVAGDDFLMFSIGKNQSVYNKVRITLTPDDLYDVEFFKMNRLGDIAKEKKYEGMYAEQLPTLFTDVTGLYTSLGTMGRRSNPRAANPINSGIKYACIMPEPGGMAYGIDERTPVTIRFSASELKRAYKCYLIPANVRESAGYKRLIAKQKEVYMSLAELKQLFRSFV